MKTRYIAVVLLLAGSIATATTAVATARHTDGPIAQLEHQWLSALRQHDTAALDRILADDFIDINVHGEIRDKTAALATRAAPAGTTQHIRNLHVRHYGDSAIATGINVVHSQARGWTAYVAFTDVFARRHGHWQAVSAQETLRSPSTPRQGG